MNKTLQRHLNRLIDWSPVLAAALVLAIVAALPG
jgi:hypothetical protein